MIITIIIIKNNNNNNEINNNNKSNGTSTNTFNNNDNDPFKVECPQSLVDCVIYTIETDISRKFSQQTAPVSWLKQRNECMVHLIIKLWYKTNNWRLVSLTRNIGCLIAPGILLYTMINLLPFMVSSPWWESCIPATKILIHNYSGEIQRNIQI